VLGGGAAGAAMLDVTHAVVVAPSALSATEQRAATMLIEEVEKRTGVRWERSQAWPEAPATVIALGPASALDAVAGKFAGEMRQGQAVTAAEGFRLVVKTNQGAPATLVLGNGSRGKASSSS